ncbi:MAG TPA: hypothetical protein VJB11_01150 [archaeon]|nr:hypothetical protein [archaeon]
MIEIILKQTLVMFGGLLIAGIALNKLFDIRIRCRYSIVKNKR